MNQYYKGISVEMLNLVTRNEKKMLEIENQRAKAIENERLYQFALQKVRESSEAVSQAQESNATSAASAVDAQANSSRKSKKKRALAGDQNLGMFGPRAKKLKEDK